MELIKVRKINMLNLGLYETIYMCSFLNAYPPKATLFVEYASWEELVPLISFSNSCEVSVEELLN